MFVFYFLLKSKVEIHKWCVNIVQEIYSIIFFFPYDNYVIKFFFFQFKTHYDRAIKFGRNIAVWIDVFQLLPVYSREEYISRMHTPSPNRLTNYSLYDKFILHYWWGLKYFSMEVFQSPSVMNNKFITQRIVS